VGIGLSVKRFRALFDIRSRELRAALLLFVIFFLTLAVFQIVKPVKNGLFVEKYGAERELFAKLANIAVAAAGVAAFTRLYNGMSRERLISVLALAFAGIFALLSRTLSNPGVVSIWAFYLAGDLLSTMMVAAFWAYLTDIAHPEQAKRLFGPIGAGGVIGGWAGSAVPKELLGTIGAHGLVVLASFLMGLIAVLIGPAEAQVRSSRVFRSVRPDPGQLPTHSPLREVAEGGRLVLASRYLAAIVGIMAFYEITSQLMDYQFKLASQSFGSVQATQAFMANVYCYANLLSVFVQFFLVSYILRSWGIVTALLVLPVSLVISALAFAASPSLTTVSLMVIFDNGLNYSLQQTARESLFTPASRDEKYKARAFINMFVQRVAKGVSIFATLGLAAIGVGFRSLSAATIVTLVLLALCSIYAGRRFSRLEANADRDRYAA
jgi:ATP:ADP antiporter, AAA family